MRVSEEKHESFRGINAHRIGEAYKRSVYDCEHLDSMDEMTNSRRNDKLWTEGQWVSILLLAALDTLAVRSKL